MRLDRRSRLRRNFLAFAREIDRINFMFCLALLAVVAAGQIAVVGLRYAFSVGFLELQGMVSYAFGALVMLSLPVALRADRHVRVEIFRERQAANIRRRVDRVSLFFFLIPIFAYLAAAALPGVLESWRVMEGSVEPGGLGGYFLVKTALPASCILLIIQGLARLADSDGTAKGRE